MSSPIKNVAVIGGSGNLGPPVVRELLKAGFSVTALSRASSSSTFPDGVTVKKVDYSSLESIKSALIGQDSVVSIVASAAVRDQQRIVDAAVAAGVKRFIPSEFGINTRVVAGQPIGKILAGKVATVDYLDQKAKENPAFTWTGLSTGTFFDWGLKIGMSGIILSTKTANIVDSGNEKWQSSNLSHIGKSIAGILKHPDQTANKYLSTASFNVSQNELVAIIEELTGSELTINHIDSKQLQKEGEEKLAKGDFSAFRHFVQAWQYADGAGHALKPGESANELLDVPTEDVKETVREWLKSSGAL